MSTNAHIGNVENLPLDLIVPSPTNPRKSFDQVALEQLAESIGEIGVTVPILVRPIEAGGGFIPAGQEVDDEIPGRFTLFRYELISGERRLRASQIAGKDHIPAIIRELTDAESLDIQLVENLQRADLHPMDEAAGYQALVAAAAERGVKLTQTELAHKVGKPLSYVAQRVKLLDLKPVARETFQAGHINVGHALILAQLTPNLQEQGLRRIFDGNNQYSKVKDVAEVVERALEAAKRNHIRFSEPARPVTELKSWVKHNVELDLEQAPWDLAADNLHPTAGSCNACPKRSSNNPALFSEMTAGEDRCLDPDCFDAKAKTFVTITAARISAGGKPMLKLVNTWSHAPLDGTEKAIKSGQWMDAKKGDCPDTREGVMTVGNEMGKVKWVCVNQKCKKHKHHVETPQQPQQKSTAAATAKLSPSEKKALEEKAKLLADQKAAERSVLYMAVRAEVAKGTRDAVLVDYVIHALDRETTVDVADIFKLNGWTVPSGRWQDQEKLLVDKLRTLKGPEFNAYIFDLTHGDIHECESWNERETWQTLYELLETHNLDPDSILAKLKADRPDLYPVETPAEPAAPKAAKAAKKAAKKTAKKAAKKVAAKMPKLSAEGRQRIAEAMKKRFVERTANVRGKAAAANDNLDDDDDSPIAVAPAPGTQCSECRVMDGWHKLHCSKNPGVQDEALVVGDALVDIPAAPLTADDGSDMDGNECEHCGFANCEGECLDDSVSWEPDLGDDEEDKD
jgi:ParB family transcriptional regulator, chromosome partitioning protein